MLNPFPSHLKYPEEYGFAINEVKNFYLKTEDGESLGAWHIPSNEQSTFEFGSHYLPTHDLTKAKIVFLFFHGNAANRGLPHRLTNYFLLRKVPGAHVVAFDYRGFGDSSGFPTETGVIKDSLTFVEWIAQSVSYKKIFFVGHSLGTGPTVKVARLLEERNTPVGGIINLGSYTTIPDAAITYPLARVLLPLINFEFVKHFVKENCSVQLDSLSLMKDLTTPLLLVHGERDFDIPVTHSNALFNAISNDSMEEVFFQDGTLLKSKSKRAWYLRLKYAGHNNLQTYPQTETALFDFINQVL